MRFLENIIHYPGCGPFQPEHSLLAFERGGGLVGILLTSAVSARVAHITQLCIDPKAQGAGLGRRMVVTAINNVRRDFECVTLTVTTSNTRAIRLYQSCGFRDLAEFPAFTWDLPVQAWALDGRIMSRFR